MSNYAACPTCGRTTYLEKNGRCYGCQYKGNPEMLAWIEKQLSSSPPKPRKETR